MGPISRDKPLVWLGGEVKTPHAVVIADVFKKKTRRTPRGAIEAARDRLRRYDHACR